MLFWVFVLFWPASNALKNHDFAGACVMVLVYGAGLVGKTLFPNLFQIFRACSYMPLFWLGFKIRQKGSAWLRKIPVLVWLLVHVGLFVFMRYLQKIDTMFLNLMCLGLNFMLCIVGSLMAFVVLQTFADNKKWRHSKLFGYFSKNTMAVYLFHQQIIYFFVFFLNGIINPYLHALTNFIGSMLISLLISSIFMKFKAIRNLLGEK